MITVANVMKLPSMFGATILAGRAGLSNPVESVSVLEYGRVTNTLDKLFSSTTFQGNELLISSFATIVDDIDAQCENIRRYHAVGGVGLILFYVGLILPRVDERVIACCNELDFVLISMPKDVETHKYSDVIGDIYHAIFRDQQSGTNYASTLIRRLVLPAEKGNLIKDLKAEGDKVMMIGDGINDSPALALSDIGVSVNSGSDIAMNSADVILMNDDLMKIPELINTSKATVRNIKQNLFWAFFYNCLMIPIAIGALRHFNITINPMFASLAMTLSSLTVIINALRLRGSKK